MKGKSEQLQHHQSFQSLLDTNSTSFDFDLWAGEVKRQMLASLQRRAAKS